MSLSETMRDLENLLVCVAKDLSKVSRGNRAAAQRVRVSTIYLEKVGKLFRKESLASEKSRKHPKKKAKKRKR